MQLFLNLVLLFNLIFSPAISFAGESLSSYDQLSPKQIYYWQKLLHYNNSNVSRIDGENFFLAKNGKENPKAEFEATINAFKFENYKVGWFKYPVQCVFRGRFDFLKNAGFLEGIHETKCPEYEEWKTNLNVDSLTVVFSSSYPNNPSSLFGHTLIRLNQKNKKNDLLDYSVSFSAIPDSNDVGFLFAFKGMFGGYKGLIEVTKYYTKVGDYVHGESRDLLEYNLKLKPEEIERFIAHVWEVYQTSYADYYFLDENCSSFLADLLQVAMIDRNGIDHHSRWYYLPAELITNLLKYDGLVDSYKFRPSLKKQLEMKLSHLSEEEIQSIKQMKQKGSMKGFIVNTKTLDALINYLDYRRYASKDQLTDEEKSLFRESLISRSKIKDESIEYSEYHETNRPELGHDSKAVSLFLRTEDNQSLIGLEFKNGYHHLMSRDLGFDPFSQFDYLTGSVVYNQNLNKIFIDEAKIVHLTSIHPYRFYDPQLSWNAEFTYARFYGNNCDNCHLWNGKMDGGFSIPIKAHQMLNLFGGAFAELNEKVKKGFRVGPVVETSYLLSYKDKMKLGLFSEIRYSARDKIKNDYQNINSIKFATFLSKNQEARLEYSMFSPFGKFSDYQNIWQLKYEVHF
jgi:hypothetical protein